MESESNPFKVHSSKINRIDIPLPEFNFFHSSSSEEGVDSKFIGREKIIRVLTSWLINKSTATGVYLITGFRGMGKSSFVGKVLYDISKEPSKWMEKWLFILYFWIIAISFFISWICTCSSFFTEDKYVGPALFFILCIVGTGLYSYFIYPKEKKSSKEDDDTQKKQNFNRIPIKLNMGHEVLNERDILGLITLNVEKKFSKYRSSIQIHQNRFFIKTLIICILTGSSLIFLRNIIYPNFIDTYQKTSSEFGWVNFIKKSYINADESVYHFFTVFFSFLIVIISIYFLWRFVMRIVNLRVDSLGLIERDLHDLNERIVASINEDKGHQESFNSGFLGLSINRKRMKNYPLADVREIEQILSNILDRINKISDIEFIIVFDELDKIDPYSNSKLQDTEGIPEFEHLGSGFIGGATSRRRKQNLLKLLGNMKFFISTAKAKFIFIAGRELYDAFLADVSDREFAIGSIFNNVIYVDSFLNSKQDHKDITFMTEQFICKQMIPDSYIESELKVKKEKEKYYTFKCYERYLESIDEKDRLDENEIKKIIGFLYQFSLYLSHVSNGAPKKIVIHFEKYVHSEGKSEEKERLIVPCPSDNRCMHYLSFGYRDQRKIGFIHYMAFPLIHAIINNATQYGDKLLVSACFLTNHIYKYHNNGFSWRNLENIPELLEVNKTPELREFIHAIILFLKQSHISPIISGLYNFKFPMRISEEISIMSRFSEEVSALFNFTLDDSLSVKSHYSKLQKFYSSQRNTVNESALHQILGDLHLLDEEFNEAIFEYQLCIQNILNKINEDDQNQNFQILNLIRIMLKLGLTHERRKTHNAAYIVYSELISKLIKFRYIDELKLGLNYMQEATHDWRNHNTILYRTKRTDEKEISSFERVVHPTIAISETEKELIEFEFSSSELTPTLSQQLTPEKNSIITRLSMFEDVRLIYQALLAKLFVLEKKGLGGITKANIDVMESEFLYLHQYVNLKDKFMISADFFKKVGDILYYKNGLINERSYGFFMGLYFWDYSIENDIFHYCSKKKSFNEFNEIKLGLEKKSPDCENRINFGENPVINQFIDSEYGKESKHLPFTFIQDGSSYIMNDHSGICSKIEICNQRRKRLFEGEKSSSDNKLKNKRLPCYACKFYNRSLKILIQNLLNDNNTDNPISKALIFLSKIDRKYEFNSLRENDLFILASSLDGLGNTLLSCSYEDDTIKSEFLTDFFKYIEGNYKNTNEIWEKINLSHLEKSILYYWAAASYFKYSSSMKEAFICYKKVLQVLVAYLQTLPDKKEEKRKDIASHLDKIKKEIFSKSMQNLFSQYEDINIVEIHKLKWIFSKQMYEKIPLNQLSLFPDIEEVILIFHELEILCYGELKNEVDTFKKSMSSIYNSPFLSTYRLESTVLERIISLRFKAITNMEILNRLLSYKSVIYETKFPILFYRNYKEFLCSTDSLDTLLGNYAGCFRREIIFDAKDQDKNELKKTRIKLIEFLIGDTLFCLSKIAEPLSPFTKTTLFTNSYVAELYHILFDCNQLYELLYMMYKWMEKVDNDIIVAQLLRMIRIKSDEIEETEKIAIIKEIRTYVNEIEEIIAFLKTNDTRTYSECFFTEIFKNIDKVNIHFNASHYLSEMSLKKYRKAKEMHREGNAYKEMIANLHFLDDDLNNDTCQFYFAVERYKNNCGFIDEEIDILMKLCSGTSLFDMDNYIG